MDSAPHTWLARPGDEEAIARLLVAFRDHLGRDWPSPNAFLASVERLMDDVNTDFVLVATVQGGPPVGVAQLRYRFGVWYAAMDCWLEDLFVDPDHRGAGVGAALLARLEERARERGCRRIELDTAEDNPALRLYERSGFAPESLLLRKRLPGG